jgi:hypothetical protein
MYYSVGHGDAGHHLRVASADQPTGPFVDEGVDLSPAERFAIDPSPFRDEDGHWYLFHARDVLEGDRVGTMLAVTALDGMTRTAGPAGPSSPRQGTGRSTSATARCTGRCTTGTRSKGPFVRRHDGATTASTPAAPWQLESYAVAYAVADHPLGPWAEPAGAEPLLRTVPGRVIGPGHNCVVGSPARRRDRLPRVGCGPDARQMCIDPVVWADDGPTVLGPSFEATTLPRHR